MEKSELQKKVEDCIENYAYQYNFDMLLQYKKYLAYDMVTINRMTEEGYINKVEDILDSYCKIPVEEMGLELYLTGDFPDVGRLVRFELCKSWRLIKTPIEDKKIWLYCKDKEVFKKMLPMLNRMVETDNEEEKIVEVRYNQFNCYKFKIESVDIHHMMIYGKYQY